MSIVLLIRSLNFGGAERQLVALAKGLVRRGHDIVVVVFYSEGTWFEELRSAGVRVVVLGKRGRWDVLGFIPRLAKLLRRLRPQVVYAFMVEPGILAVLLKPLLPRTHVVWGVRVSNIDFSRYGWFPRFAFGVSRRLARFADLIIANSWSGAAHHQALGYPARKTVVVPNGIDVDKFRPDPSAGHRQRALWRIPAHVPVIGLVGRLDPMKDHRTFLKAAQLLGQIEPQPWFVCVGEGARAYRAALEQEARHLGIATRVLWVGGQSDMVAAYNVLDVFCLSSAYGEGFPNVLAEAMSCGVPCVATDVGDAARILDGCGQVVPPHDPEQLAAGIRHALATKSAESQKACRLRVEGHFSVSRMVTETERFLQTCLNAS